jgi:CheY-like chemotaxis protein
MRLFEEFEQHLRDALMHLYDPNYQPSESLWVVTGCDPQQGVKSVQAALTQAIKDLEPTPDAPPTARIRRLYDLLSYRYIQDLTQESAAERLGITPRHLRREQQEAVHVLAQHLWKQRYAEAPSRDKLIQEDGISPPEIRPVDTEFSGYLAQVRQELASLQESAPESVADVGETIRGVVKLESALTLKHGVSLEIEHMQPDLIAATHPSALRQILITTIGKLVQYTSLKQIVLHAELVGKHVKVTITGQPIETNRAPESELIDEILAMQGGSVEFGIDEDKLYFQMKLPSMDEVTVLVVDDNLDLVHFYRRYTERTRYRILHTAQGQRAFEAIENSMPDIIVLDVMLPDVDGWELLTDLQEHSLTQSIPIIVCSVVREEELALALGATLYLPKPVRRRQFIQALDQALTQDLTRAPKAQESSAATG